VPNTIKAYRDVFTLLLRFCRDRRAIALERLSLAQIDASLVEAFLDHLGKDRQASIRTQNHRLAALHAFFRYVQSEVPERMFQCQQILAIPLQRHARTNVGYLSKENLAQILAQPDLRSREGRRDAVLLSVLYDTGARVQELIDLSVGDVRLESPSQVRLMGKGRKMRAVPLMDATVQLLRDHLRENGLDRPEHSDRPLFQNRQGGRFSRSGVRYVLQHYVEAVRCDHPGLTQPVSPHSLRHQGHAPAAERCLARNHPRLPGARGCENDADLCAGESRDETKGPRETRRRHTTAQDAVLDTEQNTA